MAQFQKIKIPRGWEIDWYSFDDINPKYLSENDDEWSNLKSNLLFLKYKMGSDYIAIDLGWYPEAKIDGEFKLQVILNKYEAEKTILMTKDKDLILSHLESILFFVANFSGEIKNLFELVNSKKYLEFSFKETELIPITLWSGVILENKFYKKNSPENQILEQLVQPENPILILSLFMRTNSSPRQINLFLTKDMSGNLFYELSSYDKNNKLLSVNKFETSEDACNKLNPNLYSGR